MSHIAEVPFRVAATLAAQRIVANITGTAHTCQYPVNTLETQLPLGITTDTVLDTTGAIPVAIAGVAKLFFNDTVTSGALVAADTSGRGVLYVATSIGAAYVGVLIGPTVAATGTIAD